MALFQSVLARRILLWYILLASFVILPLTWDVTVGCTMILAGPVGSSKQDLQGFGLFQHAVYDDADGSFLSCVKYSQYWAEQTNDAAFIVARAFGALTAAFATLATLICILVQCFNKHGKTCLWTIMKWSYVLSFVCQFVTFCITGSQICDNFQGEESKCSLGSNSVAAIFNLLFLLGMAIATCNSQPPRNPVFRLWNVIPTEYETDKVETDDDQSADIENPKHLRRVLEESDSDEDRMDSVSLFGANRSVSTRGSRHNRSSRQRASSSKNSDPSGRRSGESGRDHIPTDPSVAGSSVSSYKLTRSDRTSTKTSKSAKTNGNKSQGSNKSSVKASSVKSSRIGSATGSDPVVFSTPEDAVSIEVGIQGGSIGSGRSGTVGSKQSERSSPSKSGSTVTGRSKGSIYSNSSEADTDFVTLLGASTILGQGGIRVSEARVGNKLEIIDEYPSTPIDGEIIPPPDADGTDIVKVRTEYCPEGRKTIKDISRSDGSRIVTTVIDPMPSEDEYD